VRFGLTVELVQRRLQGISPKAYEHPADRAATAALESIPGLDKFVRKLIELRYERAFRQAYLAGSVQAGPRQLPEIWALHEEAHQTLDLPEVYNLYVTQMPMTNAAAIGAEKPMIVVNSGSIALFEPAELKTVLGHEAGHILSEHVLYQTALLMLLRLMPIGRIPPLAGLPLVAVRSVLLEWFRAAELSADRAATLVNRDPLVTCRTLMVMAAGVRSEQLDLDAFLKQSQDYHEWESSWDRVSRFFTEIGLTHSYPVRRVAELTAWVRSGDYDRIISGTFPNRDVKIDPKRAADEAVYHYRERFQAIYKEAGETFSSAAEKITDWVQGKR
jgi:Zn-dependent protease with chaperone function